jgi:hypothetical protein
MPGLELAGDVANLLVEPGTSEEANPLQGAGHAVLGTLCSRAHRIGLDGTSSLLDGLCKNVSFSFSIVVVVCVLVCPASEVVVLAEEQLQGFGDHVRWGSIDELRIEL